LLGRNDPNTTVDIDLGTCELSDPPKLSRRHAELQWVNGELELIDLGSTNGTFVDGQQLQPLGNRQPSAPVKLKIGSKIHLGNLELEVIRHE
jgi:pSer/pThr/pTyr-binding forkhead associated (FHA) protein